MSLMVQAYLACIWISSHAFRVKCVCAFDHFLANKNKYLYWAGGFSGRLDTGSMVKWVYFRNIQRLLIRRAVDTMHRLTLRCDRRQCEPVTIPLVF